MSGKTVVATGSVPGVAALSGGIAIAASAGDDGSQGGEPLARATAAALAHTDGGTVLEAEAGDDGAAYEVEVRLPGGRVVEVSLDAGFAVTGEEADDGGAGDDDGAGDD